MLGCLYILGWKVVMVSSAILPGSGLPSQISMATFPPRISVRLVDLPALSFLLLKMAILYVLFAFCIKTRKVLKQSSLLDWPFSICGVTRHWMGTFSKQFRCWSSRYQKIWLKTLHLLRTLSSAAVIHRILFRSTFWPNTSDQNILPKYIRPFWLVSVTNRIFRYFLSLPECSVHEGNITVLGG